MSKVFEISGVTSSASQRTIAELQDQMARYTQTANDLSSQANASYKALQNAIRSGDVIAAQVALYDLEREDGPVGSSGSTISPTTASAGTSAPVNTQPSNAAASNAANSGAGNSAATHSIDAFA